MNRIKLYNGKLILEDSIEQGSILIENGKILGVEKKEVDFPDAWEIDAKGKYISPGFIDIHVHGGNNHDFMDATEESFLEIASFHAKHGTTSMMPTSLTADKKGILNTLDVYESARSNNKSGSRFIGLHLEGPYFSMNQRGAQDPQYIRDPDPAEYMEILNHSHSIKRWSIAPEKKGALALGKILENKGIIASMAHTDALYEEAVEAMHHGFTLLTHFYSAMSSVTRKNAMRFAGVVEAGYLHDELFVEIIADGVHLPAPLLQLILKIKGREKTILITDAMRGAGMPEGPSILGNKTTGIPVILENGVAKLIDRTAFAGSIATANQLIKNIVILGGASLVDAIYMITKTPAKLLGLEHEIGSLKKGMHADVVLMDSNYNITHTFIQGKQLL